ncbi:MAG: hypothetical protein ACFFE6_06410 [Candidatus Thorarchaeota archaeon]
MGEKKIKIKKIGKAIADHCIWGTHLDFLCDECNSRMKPGGNFQHVLGGREYQFCTEKCMKAYVEKWVPPSDAY